MPRNDGKYFEDIIQDELKARESVNFAFMRMYDSYSAQGNPLPAQPADYLVCSNGSPFFLELKTTGHKKGRLPKGSFSQLPTMARYARAGFPGYLLCHCYGFDGEIYLVNVLDMDPSLKSWVVVELGKQVLVTNFLEEI